MRTFLGLLAFALIVLAGAWYLNYSRLKSDLIRAVRTHNRGIWLREMYALTDPRHPKAESIKAFLAVLKDGDPKVRIDAARFLFELGSDEGRSVLIDTLNRAHETGIDDDDLSAAAKILHKNRQAINAAVLYRAYTSAPSDELLHYLVLEQIPDCKSIVASKLKEDLRYVGSAGMLRLDDTDSLTIYNHALQSSSAAFRLEANWALYRATGDKKYLNFIIDTALEGVGIIPNINKSADLQKGAAISYLQIIAVPEAQDALEQIAIFAAKNHDVTDLPQALASLYYVYQDFTFLDKMIFDFMKGVYPRDAGGEMIWQIAAARGDWKIANAALARHAESYLRYFVDLKGRSVQSWIFSGMTEAIPNDSFAVKRKK